MVNHFRTLLMNVDGSATSGDYIAEEIVDPYYAAVPTSPELRAIRYALFGTDPDRHMLNYRCRQLLACVHASPLVEYVTGLDQRITYNFDNKAITTQWGIVLADPKKADAINFYGELESPDAIGRVQRSFIVRVIDSGNVTVERMTPPYKINNNTISIGQPVVLPGSGISFTLHSVTAPQIYVIDTYAKPSRDLSEVAKSLTNLGDSVYRFLFGVTQVEPFTTFRNLWTRQGELPLRVGAITCALAYRMDQLRKGY